MADNSYNMIVSNPVTPFTMSRSFKACSNGKIFIGLPDTDPTFPQNQIPVYVENECGKMVQVPQPIVINAAGYPVYHGQVAKFVTTQNYSMVVYDSYMVQQFYWGDLSKIDPESFAYYLTGGVKYIPWLTPQYHGAKGDGVTDDTAAINAMFTSGAESYRIPSGTYLISSTIKQTISKNIRIVCEPGVVFKLADNSRQHLFQISGNGTTGDGTNTYEWFGGELDGNWAGQGSEPYAADGHFSDISHGMIVCNFYKVEIADLYSHSFMGHNINHGGNTYIHAHDIRFNSHTATNFPQGGSRSDGITGCSRNVLIENIYGFTTDDMVAVFAGCTWIPGIGTGDALVVDNVTIRNINPWYKQNDQDSSITTYTWNAVVVSHIGGYDIDKIIVENVKGYTQYSDVRVGGAPAGTDSANDYYGSAGSVIINNIDVRVNGASTDQHLHNMVRVGAFYPASYSNKYETIIKSLTISNVKCYPSGNNRTLIAILNTTIYTLDISNITVNGLVADDTYNIIYVNSDRQVGIMRVNGVVHNPASASSDTVANARLCINWSNTFSSARCKLMIDNLPIVRNSANTAYISNVLVNASSYAPEIYGYDAVVRTGTNFYALPVAAGVHCTDRYLGRVRYGSKGVWEFEEWFTKWDSTTFGRPAEALMPGYSNITFSAGMSVNTTGSPLGEVKGWLYNGSSWQMIGESVPDSQSVITVKWLPTSASPYITINSAIYNDSTWPESFGYLKTFTGYSTGRSGATQEFINSAGTKKYIRTWSSNNSSWNAWYSMTLTAV